MGQGRAAASKDEKDSLFKCVSPTQLDVALVSTSHIPFTDFLSVRFNVYISVPLWG